MGSTIGGLGLGTELQSIPRATILLHAALEPGLNMIVAGDEQPGTLSNLREAAPTVTSAGHAVIDRDIENEGWGDHSLQLAALCTSHCSLSVASVTRPYSWCSPFYSTRFPSEAHAHLEG